MAVTDIHERVLVCAEFSVLRGVGFASLAISTTMFAFAFELSRSFMAGAILAGVMAAILGLKALAAPAKRYKKTEVWILLEKKIGLSDERAQKVIGGVLRSVYIRFARYSLYGALAMWTLAILLSFATGPSGQPIGIGR